MDISENLCYTYEEQCFLQLEQLRKELIDEETRFGDKDRWQCHRMFRNNYFDEMDVRKRKRCDKLLKYSLKSLGEHLNNNIMNLARGTRSTLSTPTPVRDLSDINSMSSSSRSRSHSRSSSRSLSRSPSIELISRPFRTMNSNVLTPIKEVIYISSDEELEDDEDAVIIKREHVDSDENNPGVTLQDINRGSTSNQRTPPINEPNSSNQRYPPNSILLVDRKHMDNYTYDSYGVIHLKPKKHIRFYSNKSRQALMLFIIAKALKLVGTETYMTQRQLYYLSLDFCRMKSKNKNNTFQSQTQSQTHPLNSQADGLSQGVNEPRVKYSTGYIEASLNDICCLVGCSRVHLHILAQTKGLVYGNLKYQLKTGEKIDCFSKKEGTPMPNSNVPITRIESDAKFILVIEKDSVFQKIISQESKTTFCKSYKAILVTAKGYPDVNTRAFLSFVWSKLNIPILALTDADPHGVEIIFSYKFGSYTTAYEGPTIAIPQMRWLGLLPSDVEKLSIPEAKTIPQTDLDRKKINSLLARPYLSDKTGWKDQLMLMRSTGRKAELEVIDESGEFLVSTYLPNKLRYASWL